MANHVIYDLLWLSQKLRRCSKDAALAYPWIFLVADDYGRFEYDPRGIWSKCFAVRQDVTVEDVARWLGEYEREKLLSRYHIDGDLAVWYKFRGRKASERRPSQYPDPAQFKRRDKSRAGGDVARKRRDKSTPDIDQDLDQDQEIEQIRSGAEIAPAAAVAPPNVPSTALVPSTERPWSAEAIDDYRELRGDLGKHEGRVPRALKPSVDRHGWAVVRPQWRDFLLSDEGKFGPENFAANFVARLRPKARPPPRPAAKARLDQANAMISGGMRDERTLGAGDEKAGGDIARPGLGAGDGDGTRNLLPESTRSSDRTRMGGRG